MSRDDLKGIIIILLLMTLGVTAFVFAYKLQPKAYDIDSGSMCLKNEPIPLTKIVLIDKSDRWNAANVEKIDNWLSDIYEGLPLNGRLRIMSLTGAVKKKTKLNKLFDKCSPGSEEDCNALYENCRDIRAKFINAFQDPLFEITTMLSKSGTAETSPIFETMTTIVDDLKSKKAEIHIISDFMENGYKFNFYQGTLPNVKDIIKEYALPTNTKVTIYLHIIERRKHKIERINAVKKIWQDYFTQQGFRVKEAKRFFITD